MKQPLLLVEKTILSLFNGVCKSYITKAQQASTMQHVYDHFGKFHA